MPRDPGARAAGPAGEIKAAVDAIATAWSGGPIRPSTPPSTASARKFARAGASARGRTIFGTIDHVIDDFGPPTDANTSPSNVVEYPPPG